MSSPQWLPGRSVALDVFAMLAVVVLNPALYALGSTTGTLLPDGAMYLSLANGMVESGALVVDQAGAEPIGLVLPPLYPLLIALASWLGAEPVYSGELVSWASVMLTGLILYGVARQMTGRLAAMAAVAAIQINYFYFGYAFVTLTEALFMLVLALSVLLFQLSLRRPRSAILALLVGAGCGLLFLSRQMGLFLIVFVLAWELLIAWRRGRRDRRLAVRRVALIVVGALSLLLPYSVVLFAQSGQGPLVQYFDQGDRVVIDDPTTVAEYRRLSAAADVADYHSLVTNRRELRQLTPDNHAMYVHVEVAGDAPRPGLAAKVLGGNLMDPAAYLRRLLANLRWLTDAVGGPFFWLFVASLLTAVAIRGGDRRPPPRLLLGSLVVAYLAVASLFTGLLGRYVHVIAPFVVIAVVSEMWVLMGRLAAGLAVVQARTRLRDTAVLVSVIGAVLLCAWQMPLHYRSFLLKPAQAAPLEGLEPIRSFIEPGEPVMALLSSHSYFAGGSWRMLPNAELDRVIDYADQTGVRWLLVWNDAATESESSFNDHLGWYRAPNLERLATRRLIRRASLYRGTVSLFEVVGRAG